MGKEKNKNKKTTVNDILSTIVSKNSIKGDHPIVYAFKKGIDITGQHPIDFLNTNELPLSDDKKQEILSDIVKHAILNNIPIYGQDPVLYAHHNKIKINGMYPVQFVMDANLDPQRKNEILNETLKYAIANKLNISNMNPVVFARQNNLTIDKKDPISYVMKMDTMPEAEKKALVQEALKTAILFGGEINGQDPIVYAHHNKILIDGMPPVQFAISRTYTPEARSKVLNGVLKYAINNREKISGMDPVVFARYNDLTIDRRNPMEYVMSDPGLDHQKAVNVNKNAVYFEVNRLMASFVNQNARTNSGIDKNFIVDFVTKHEIPLGGKNPIQYMCNQALRGGYHDKFIGDLLSQKEIGGLPPIEYLVKNNIRVGYQDIVEYLNKNPELLKQAGQSKAAPSEGQAQAKPEENSQNRSSVTEVNNEKAIKDLISKWKEKGEVTQYNAFKGALNKLSGGKLYKHTVFAKNAEQILQPTSTPTTGGKSGKGQGSSRI